METMSAPVRNRQSIQGKSGPHRRVLAFSEDQGITSTFSSAPGEADSILRDSDELVLLSLSYVIALLPEGLGDPDPNQGMIDGSKSMKVVDYSNKL